MTSNELHDRFRKKALAEVGFFSYLGLDFPEDNESGVFQVPGLGRVRVLLPTHQSPPIEIAPGDSDIWVIAEVSEDEKSVHFHGWKKL